MSGGFATPTEQMMQEIQQNRAFLECQETHAAGLRSLGSRFFVVFGPQV